MKIEKLKGTKSHTRYRLSTGEIVPGATTVINQLHKPALVHWAWELGNQGIDYRKYTDKLAQVGTIAHYLVMCHFTREQPDLTSYSQQEVSMAENALISFYEWERQHSIEPILNEHSLVSERYKFGGTVDMLCLLDGVPTLVDFKTSRATYFEHYVQLAAYKALLEENGYTVKKCRIIRIGRDESEGFDDKVAGNIKAYWKVFKALLDIYYLRREIERGS